MLQIHNCFWKRFWQCLQHNQMWYWNSNLTTKGYVTRFPLSPKMVALTNRRNKTQAEIMKWHISEGSKLPGMAQKIGSNQDKPSVNVQLHPWPSALEPQSSFYGQGKHLIYCCKSKRADGTRTHTYRWMIPSEPCASFPSLRSQLPHQGLILHVLQLWLTESATSAENISAGSFSQKVKQGRGEGGQGWLGGNVLTPILVLPHHMVWLSFMTSAPSHCLAPPPHSARSGESRDALMDGAEGRLHHICTRGSGSTSLPPKPPWRPTVPEKMHLVASESKDPSNVNHKNAQTIT